MLHIHRHVVGLRSFEPFVITQKCEGRWPGPRPEVVERSPRRPFAREWHRLVGGPWQISRNEAARIQRMICDHHTDLLHVFFGNVAIHLLPLLRILDVPFVVSFHGSDVTGSIANADHRAAREEVFARAAGVFCRSSHLASRVRELGAAPSRIRLMRTVLPPVEFVERTAPTGGAWKFAIAARLVPKKGIATAIRAFAEFAVEHPNASLEIAGDGPLEPELRRLAADCGVADRVSFRGFLDQTELARLFAEAHVYLQPSEAVGGDVEGVPNALLEAMATGLPAVATSHGGIPEVIESGVHGLLIPEGNPAALSAAMGRLTSEPELARTLARAGAARVSSLFSADAQMTAIEGLYREAIAQSAIT
ncbi:MAG: glycosyltransferase [Terrimicrobiaceae bacterium]|nr:glycosyltransferase [Terrimicrobiaceae bacterium]